MELRQLQYFIAVGRLSSITKAADHLHTSQPNISMAIQKLEDELGVPLFHRKQKRLSLTNEGSRFLDRVEQAIVEIREAVADVTQSGNVQRGRIRIGIPPTIGATLFPQMLSRFNVLHPGIELEVVEEGTWSLRDMIENGELDLGIMILAHASSRLNTLFLSKQQIMVCLPPDHPLSAKAAITFQELEKLPLIVLGENSYHHHMILKEFERLQLKPHVKLTSNQVETIKGLVANRIGISFLFEGLTRQETSLVARPLSPPLFVEMGLAWKKGRHVSPASRQFINFFQDANSVDQKISSPTGQ